MVKSERYTQLLNAAAEQLVFDEEKFGKEPNREHIAEVLDDLGVEPEDGRAEKWKESGCFYISSSGGCPICSLSVKQKDKLSYLNQLS